MAEQAPEDQEHKGIKYLTWIGAQEFIGRTVMGTIPPEPLEDFLFRDERCEPGVSESLRRMETYPTESAEYRKEVEDGQFAIEAFKGLLNPAQ
jgi:hypothetical protein